MKLSLTSGFCKTALTLKIIISTYLRKILIIIFIQSCELEWIVRMF